MASSTPSQNYQVFLSFRGEDTRKTFTDHLFHALTYAGIRTFRDNEELESGDCISSGLLRAIQESKVSIVVFSKDYAASRWCLDELVEILECKKANRQVVLPVFYYVDPSDVRKQKGSFADAFMRHDQVFEETKVKTWRSALKQAASLSGFHLQNQYEAKFIKEILEKVVQQVNPKCLHVAKYPVGLDYHEKMINSLLGTRKDVLLVGIYGIGGIGKTTIAKHFYNSAVHQYECCCFLENIREASQQPNGLICLQKKLLSEIQRKDKVKITNLSRGISLLEHTLGIRRVLIVLDDLDQPEILNSLAGSRCWFAKGSLVIITTRNKHLLEQADVDVKYEVKELNYEDSMMLFSWHAFGNPVPSESYISILKDIVTYAGGLPLALEVLGSSLVNKSLSVWKSMLKKLKVIPHDKIQAKLKISFEALDDTEKDIFLDAACFFVGMDKELATMIFDGCGFYGDAGVSALVDRCLLKIVDGKLSMQDLLRDMGRGIINKRFPREPGKRTRLWRPDDVIEVLSDNKGTEAIEGIILDLPTQEYFCTRPFASMRNLRLLKLSNVDLGGSFEGLFRELRWLCWHGCPLQSLPPELHLRKLVCLEMQKSNLRILWKGTKFLGNLRSMDLSESRFLTTTPDFSEVPKLEELRLHYCESLSNIDPSIGCLDKLISLDLKECRELESLPSSISGLTSLQKLDVEGCSRLEGFPEELGGLKSLQSIYAEGTGIKELPDSIGNLGQLTELWLTQCQSIKSLPRSISGVTSLQTLVVSWCSDLEGFPEQLGDMKCLKCIAAEGTRIKELPDSIGNLGQLTELWLTQCQSIKSLPSSISGLTSLQQLHVSFCSSLEGFPEELGGLKSLRYIYAAGSGIKELPDSIGNLGQPTDLGLGIPITGPIRGRSRAKLHYYPVGKMKCLKLQVAGTAIKELPLSIGLQNNLDGLFLSGNNFCSLPSSVTQRTNLRILSLDYFSNLQSVLGLPPNLESLIATDCTSLRALPKLLKLGQLQRIDLENCKRLVGIQGLENLASVEQINLEGCTALEKLPDLSNLKHLCWLKLKNCIKLQNIQGLENRMVVEHINLDGCTSLENLPIISNTNPFYSLDLQNCNKLVEIQGMENLKSIQQIFLGGCSSNLSTTVLKNFLSQGPCQQLSFLELYLSRQDIPACFENQGMGGSPISFDVPLHFPDDSFHVHIWLDYDIDDNFMICIHIIGETDDTKWSREIWAGNGLGKVSLVMHVPHTCQIKRGYSYKVSFKTKRRGDSVGSHLNIGKCGVRLAHTSERRSLSLLPLCPNNDKVQLKRMIDSDVAEKSSDGSKRMKQIKTMHFPQSP